MNYDTWKLAYPPEWDEPEGEMCTNCRKVNCGCDEYDED